MEKRDIIKQLYNMNEKKLDEIIKHENKKLKTTKTYKEFQERIKMMEQEENIQGKEILDDVEEYYNKKISSILGEIYKQGFLDGMSLILECLFP